MRRSIAPSSIGAESYLWQSWEDFITIIAESSFQHTQLYQLHGAIFTAWVALLVAQTALVAGHRTDIHRTLGVAGVVLAAIVFVVGVAVSVETLRRNGGPPGGDPPKFFAIPVGDIIAFAALVSAAVVQRRHSEVHKRLMLLATISLLTAAVGRFLRQVGMGGAPNLFFGTEVFVLVLVLYDFASRGRVHPATLWGGALVLGSSHCCTTCSPARWRGSPSPTLCVFSETRLPTKLPPAVTST